MTEEIQSYCNGMGCPVKEKCGRYQLDIDPKHERHLAYAPYSHIEKYCGFATGEALKIVSETREKFRHA